MIKPRILRDGKMIVPVAVRKGKDVYAETAKVVAPGTTLYKEWLPVAKR